MINFLKKYKNIIIIAVVILLVAGVITFKVLTTNNIDNTDSNTNYEIRMYDFTMVGCGPCAQVKPTVDKIKEKYKEIVDFKEVDVNKEPIIATEFGVQYTPTFVFTDMEDNIISGFVGIGTEDDFTKFIEEARSRK